MIKANEFRLGNWFYDGFTDRKGNLIPATVKAISETIPDNDALHLSFAEPIPLTPEILEQCGFELVSGIYWCKHHIALEYLNNLERWDVTKSAGEISLDVSIQYLHQLQNLYFALTGEELQINLPQQ